MSNQSTTPAKPTHRLFLVTGKGKAATWTPIANRDGEGFSLQCEAIPLTGRLVMRAISERPAAE